jgi:hypothetical protein
VSITGRAGTGICLLCGRSGAARCGSKELDELAAASLLNDWPPQMWQNMAAALSVTAPQSWQRREGAIVRRVPCAVRSLPLPRPAFCAEPASATASQQAVPQPGYIISRPHACDPQAMCASHALSCTFELIPTLRVSRS